MIIKEANINTPFISSRESLMSFCADKAAGVTERMLSKIMGLIGLGKDEAALPLLPIDIAEIMGHQVIVDRLRPQAVFQESTSNPLIQHGLFNSTRSVPHTSAVSDVEPSSQKTCLEVL